MCEKMEKSDYTVVEEGSEDDAFWDALGGKKEYFDTPLSEVCKLFHKQLLNNETKLF